MLANNLPEIVHQLLAARPGEMQQNHVMDFAQWKSVFNRIQDRNQQPWQQALIAGYHADSVGYAFAAGYQAALTRLLGCRPQGLMALCVTESQGNHPKAIATTLTKNETSPGEDLWVINGSKTFITGGTHTDLLLVAARQGEQPNGLPNIRLVQVPATAAGVTLETMAPLGFVPEIDHASIHLHQVIVNSDAILSGDGYRDYVKPFRTIEDTYVCLALCGYLLKTARLLQANNTLQENILASIASHQQLTTFDPKDPACHLLLAGARHQLEYWLLQLENHWQATDHEGFTLWQRDKALLKVAAGAREKRTATAWNQF